MVRIAAGCGVAPDALWLQAAVWLHGVALLQAAALRQMRSRQAPVLVLFVYEKGDSYAR